MLALSTAHRLRDLPQLTGFFAMDKRFALCAPPDPNTKIPVFKMPPGACDAHCHVFGPADIFPYADDRSYTPPDAGKEALAALHAKLGIERAVIVHASCHGSDMRVTLDSIASSQGRYRGVAITDEGVSEKELRRLHDGGIRGVRYNFVKHLGGVPDLNELHRVADIIAPMGWHLVFHFDAIDLLEFGPMLKGLKLPFVIDHMGRVKASDGLDQEPFRILLDVMKMETAWVKVCGSERVSSAGPPFHDSIPFAQALVKAAPHRVLWGTDFPHPNVGKHMPNDGDLVDLVPLIAPDKATQNLMLVENPTLLYFTS
jgi:2-pyrone-4,6-dicarboxylate lactonase